MTKMSLNTAMQDRVQLITTFPIGNTMVCCSKDIANSSQYKLRMWHLIYYHFFKIVA